MQKGSKQQVDLSCLPNSTKHGMTPDAKQVNHVIWPDHPWRAVVKSWKQGSEASICPCIVRGESLIAVYVGSDVAAP